MRFLIHQLLMGKYHMRTLSMKYPTCICIPLHKTFLWKKRPCFSMVSTVCSWMQSTFCLSELSVLQAVTILVAMASRKKFWRLKLLWKSPNWPPVFSYHVPSFSLFLSEIVQTMCTVHFLCFAIVQALSTVIITCELLLIAAFLYLRVLLVFNLLVHLMHHLLTGISSQELPLLQQRTEQPLAKTTSTLTWMLLVLSMECLYMSLIWTLLMINLGENRVRIISLKYQLPVCCLSEVDSTAPHGEVDLLTG